MTGIGAGMTSRARRLRLSMRKRHMLHGYLLISPFLIGCLLFFAFPVITSFRLSFSKLVKMTGLQMTWIGIDNYMRAFVWDLNFIPMFLKVIKNTFINTPLISIFSLLIAVMINKKFKLRGFFRAVFFLPFLLGSGYILDQLLGMGVESKATSLARGILMPEELLQYMGVGVMNAVNEFFNRITLILWRSGVQIQLFLSALQTIPESLYESAKCDAATEWEMFWMITLPMTTPVILLNAVYTIVDSFTDITNPIVSYMNNLGFSGNQFEYAAAIGWIYFSFIFLVIFFVNGFMKRFIRNVSSR